jgi:outer membrane lipoprotein-sorting protein
MAGHGPAIHALATVEQAWMPAPGAGMTQEEARGGEKYRPLRPGERRTMFRRRMSMTPTPPPLSRRRLFTALAATAVGASLPRALYAAPPRPAALTPQDQQAVQGVQQYLNSIKTLQSRFQQFTPDGGVAQGTIYLQRPGKMRIVYDDPVPILIVADGWAVYYWDKSLQQLSQIGVKDTPAWFLLRPDITLSGDITVTRFERTPGALRLSMVETKNADQGNLTVVLSEQPMELKQWTVIDAQQKPVTVTLVDPHYGMQLSPTLFAWTEQKPRNQ